MAINPDPEPLQELTEFDDFTLGRECSTCTSDACPGTNLIQFGKQNLNQSIDEYSCFIKSRLLDDLEVDEARSLLLNNNLLEYIGKKTQAVTKSSTSRGSYGNLSTLLEILRDYVKNYDDYEQYDGIEWNQLQPKIQSIPGCSKIQNHPANQRLNEDYKKYYGRDDTYGPVNRIPIEGRRGTTYKINHGLLEPTGDADLNKKELAELMIDILELYFYFREYGDIRVVEKCEELKENPLENEEEIIKFLDNTVNQKDAREFEVASFVILKGWFATKSVMFGESRSQVEEHQLELYKTGSVNANDGGIDYVLTPVGRFFQATQNFKFDKYFLDIEKLSKFPITFIIQTDMSAVEASKKIEQDARKKYEDEDALQRYLNSFEKIFTLKHMTNILSELQELDGDKKETIYSMMMDEYARQYAVEYKIDYEFEQKLVERDL